MSEGYLCVWDSFNKSLLSKRQAHSKSIRAVAYSPTGRHYVSSALDGTIKLWSALTHVEVGGFFGHTQPISRCMFSKTGLELMTVAADKKVKVWLMAHYVKGPSICALCVLYKLP